MWIGDVAQDDEVLSSVESSMCGDFAGTVPLFHPMLVGTVTKLCNSQRWVIPQSVHGAFHHHLDSTHICRISSPHHRLGKLLIKSVSVSLVVWGEALSYWKTKFRSWRLKYHQVMLPGVAEVYWHILGGSCFSGLSQGTPFSHTFAIPSHNKNQILSIWSSCIACKLTFGDQMIFQKINIASDPCSPASVEFKAAIVNMV